MINGDTTKCYFPQYQHCTGQQPMTIAKIENIKITETFLADTFATYDPDNTGYISMADFRDILHNYAKGYNVSLRIQEHLSNTQQISFSEFTGYFIRDVTENPLISYSPHGVLQWKSNIPSTTVEQSSSKKQQGGEDMPPSAEKAISVDSIHDILSEMRTDPTGQISFAKFLQYHNPNPKNMCTIDLDI